MMPTTQYTQSHKLESLGLSGLEQSTRSSGLAQISELCDVPPLCAHSSCVQRQTLVKIAPRYPCFVSMQYVLGVF